MRVDLKIGTPGNFDKLAKPKNSYNDALKESAVRTDENFKKIFKRNYYEYEPALDGDDYEPALDGDDYANNERVFST